MSEEKQPEGRQGYDLKLLVPVLLLVGIGVVMVYSASSAVAMKKYGDGYFFLKKQAVFAGIGIIILVLCRRLPYKYYRALAYPILFLGLALLGSVFIPGIGYSAGGALRWIRVMGFNFQPAEFARLAVVIYLSYSLSKKQERVKEFSVGFVPHAIVLALFIWPLSQQPDFGAAAILCIITWIMLFIGGVRLLHLCSAFVVIIPFAFYFMISAQYRLKRLISFLDPWQYSSEEGYQTIHSLMAFGSGGLWGAGIGKSFQKLFYLPEPHTDFIFSVIGEEVGFVGILFIISLYVLIITRGIMIARKAKDIFASFLASGITIILGLQVCVNMCVSLGMLPTKGLTLPFLSYGGTSLVLSMAMAGILMNIEAASFQPPK